MCAPWEMDIIKVGRAGELPVPAATFLSLRFGLLWSCENRETAGCHSDVDDDDDDLGPHLGLCESRASSELFWLGVVATPSLLWYLGAPCCKQRNLDCSCSVLCWGWELDEEEITVVQRGGRDSP